MLEGLLPEWQMRMDFCHGQDSASRMVRTYLQGKEKVIMPKGKQLVTNGAGVTTEKVLENAK